MTKSMALFIVAAAASLTGCGTAPAQPPAASPAAMKTECMTRYNAVTQACLALHAGEKGGPELLNRLRDCERIRGFPRGSDTCQ